MCYKSFCVYFLTSVFLFPYVVSDEKFVTIQASPNSTLKFKETSSSEKVVEYFYNYTYSDGDVAYFNCKATGFEHDPNITWIVSRSLPTKKIGMASCSPKTAEEYNYVTKLTKYHNGNNLTCIVKYDQHKTFSAQVQLNCPNCEDVNNKRFDSSCHNNTINMFINGVIKNTTSVIHRDEVVTVHCEGDTKMNEVLTFGNNEFLKSLNIHPISLTDSVVSLQFNMNEYLSNPQIVCEKRNKNTNTLLARKASDLRLHSELFITVKQPGQRPWYSSVEDGELSFEDNETISFTCQYLRAEQVEMVWLRNHKIVNASTEREKQYIITLKEADDNESVTCEIKLNGLSQGKRTIVFKYKRLTSTVAAVAVTETSSTSSSRAIAAKPEQWELDNAIIIAIGVAAVLLLIIVMVFVVYKKRRSVKAVTNEISYSNFQNENVYSPRPSQPTLDPLYSGPVDDVNIYSYTTPQQLPQETYSTPFVPTVEEMYTEPTPKKLRVKGKTTYPLPGKNQYANILASRRNQLDPGYSTVPNDSSTSDSASETYTYCSVPGYSRVN